MEPPFYRGPTLRLDEYDQSIRVIATDGRILACVRAAVLIDATASDGELRLFAASGDYRFGQLAKHDADAAAKALAARFGTPKALEIVEEEDVRRDPHHHHGRHLQITALWSWGFEESSLAGASFGCDLTFPDNGPYGSGSHLVRARGVWLCEHVPRRDGRLGACRPEFVAYSAEGIEPASD